MRKTLIPLCFLPVAALAEPVQIPGPGGPLEAEMLAHDGAAHVVVLIPGSGPTDRDGNSPQGLATDSYQLLAEALASEGVASLRIDKRGFFGSAAALDDPNDVTIAAYAEDARDWVMRAVDLAPCVWLAGHSEGGLVALIAALEAPDALCGLLLLATPGRPIGQLLVEQMEANPANAALAPDVAAIVAELEAGRMVETGTVPAALRPLFAPGVQRFMVDLFAYDPVEVARRYDGPVLIVQGGADLQVRSVDADRLQDALPQATRLDLVDGTHMLKVDIPGQPGATYTDPTLPLHPDLVSGIMTFLTSVD